MDGKWPKTIRINVEGVVTGTKLGFKYMGKDNGGAGGTIINIGSITPYTPSDPFPVYSATKAFVIQFSRSYGQPIHYKNTGVKVIALNPGLTDTLILEDALESRLSKTEEFIAHWNTFYTSYIMQSPDNMGRGLIHVLENDDENGTLWTVENDKPPRKVNLHYTNA